MFSLFLKIKNLIEFKRFQKEKITKVLQLWQKNSIFSNDLIDKLLKLTDLMIKNDNIDFERIFKGTLPSPLFL